MIINSYKKEKARESVPVTRPATQGLRIAQLASTSNAKIAHADMYNDKAHLLLVKSVQWYITYPVDIYRCFAFGELSKFAKFWVAKDKNVVNVFS